MKKDITPASTGTMGKMFGVFKKKSLIIKSLNILKSDFITTDMYKLNQTINKFGIALGEKDGGSVIPFTQIEGIKEGVDFTNVLPLFDKKNGDYVVIHIAPSTAYNYTIKNATGVVVLSIKSSAGEPTNIVRISGSQEFFTLEGDTNV